MSFLKMLINGILLFGVIFAYAEKSEEDMLDYIYDRFIDPIYYDVQLQIAIKRGTYSGHCIVKFRLKNETQIIKIHARGLHIYTLILRNKNETYDLKMNIGPNVITLYLHDTIMPGDYILVIDYWAFLTFYDNGIFKTSYMTTKDEHREFVISRIQNVEIHRMFPCWNHPAYSSAVIYISVLHHRNYTVLCNIQQYNTSELSPEHETHLKWTRFKGFAMPLYQVAIVMSTFFKDPVADFNIQCRPETVPHLRLADDIIKNLTLYFQNEWIQIKNYVFRGVNHVAVTAYPENSFMTRGLVLYREADVMYDDKINSFVDKLNVAKLVARGVAYQYFSGIVNLADWRYMWLHDGLTTLLAIEAVQKKIGIPVMDLFVVETVHESFRWDHFFMEPLVYDPINVSTFNSLKLASYHLKAPSILRMLQHIFTEEIFQKGINMYLYNRKYYPASVKDFWGEIEAAYRSKEPNDVRHMCETNKIETIMDTWVNTQNYPILYVARVNTSCVRILVENAEVLSGNWCIPLTLTHEMHPNFTLSQHLLWLRKGPNTSSIYFPLSELESWMIVNIQQVGYYRVKYTNHKWNKIGKYLREQNYSNIHVLNRAQIVDDAFYFFKTNQLDLSTFFAIVQYLWREADFIAWYPMFKAFEYITCFLPFQESHHFMIQIKLILEKIPFISIRNLFDPNLGTYFKSFQAEITRWVCIFNISECARLSSNKIVEDLKQERTYVPKDKEWIYNTASRNVDRVTWKNMFSLYLNKSNNDILKYLAFNEDPYIIIDYMNMIVSKDYAERMEGYDRAISFLSIITRHSKNDIVLDYILNNFERIKPKETNLIIVFVSMINHIYSKPQLDKIHSRLDLYSQFTTETSFIITMKNQFYYNEQPKFLLSHNVHCKPLIENCVLRYMEKLFWAIRIKIHIRLHQMSIIKSNFINFDEQYDIS